MIVDGDKIIAPVTVEDISAVLSVGSTDIGYLCSNKHGKTNKYSKKKPVIIEGDDINLISPTTWWKGENLQCGLNIPYRTAITSCINDYFDGSMKWGYDAPPPNSKYPARLLDFDGYYHKAICPVSAENFPKDIWLESTYGGAKLSVSLDIATEGDEYNLGLSDINIRQITGSSERIMDWYPGLIFKLKNGTRSFAKTSDETLSTGSFVVNITGTQESLSGDWQIAPFLSPIKVDTLLGDDKKGHYILLESNLEGLPLETTIHRLGTLTWSWVSAGFVVDDSLPKNRYIEYIGQIINSSTSEYKYNVTLYVGYTPDGNHPLNGGVLTNVMKLKIGEIVVPAAASTDKQDEVVVWFASKNFADGKYDYLDIGTVYAPNQENTPNAIYWTFVQLDNEVIPYESYWPIEQAAPDDEETAPEE